MKVSKGDGLLDESLITGILEFEDEISKTGVPEDNSGGKHMWEESCDILEAGRRRVVRLIKRTRLEKLELVE